MSWKTINAMLGLAATDEAFCQELLQNPVQAALQRQFTLTREEQDKLSQIHANDLAEFSQQVLKLFHRQP